MKIAERRKHLGLTQESLCSLIGISRQALSAIERGTEQPRVGLALAISGALGVSVEELFKIGSDDESASVVKPDAGRPGVYGIFNDRVRFRSLPDSNVDGFWQAPNGIDYGREKGLSRFGAPGVFIDGCDPLLGMLSGHLSRLVDANFYWWSVPNHVAKKNLRAGSTHIALVHGPGDQMPRVGSDISVVGLADWDLCIATKPGNPMGIRSLDDLFEREVKIAPRVSGSGVRDRSDSWAKERGLTIDSTIEFDSHLDACNAVRYGEFEATFAMSSVAKVARLDVLPIEAERSWLLIDAVNLATPSISRALDEVSSGRTRTLIDLMPGYRRTR